MLLITGCKKDDHSSIQNPGGIPAADLKLSRMIEAFRSKEVTHLKSGEEMCVDSAIWYLNVTANYTYGSASYETEKVAKNVATITLPVTNNKVLLSAVYSKYEEMIDSIREYYRNIPSTEKQLISVTVETDTVLQDAIVLAVTSTVGTGIIEHLCDFNEVDSWIWWNTGTGGICAGPNYGQGQGSDAAEQMQNKIMICRTMPGGNYWYETLPIHHVYAWEYSNPNWGGTNYNYYRYRMFWSSSQYPNHHGCLSPEECNFYLAGTKWIIYTAESAGGERPDEATFISVDVQGSAFFYDYTDYFHQMNIEYGILHIAPNPPIPID